METFPAAAAAPAAPAAPVLVGRVLRGFQRFFVFQISKPSFLMWVSKFFFGSGLFFLVFLVIFVALTLQKCSFPRVFGALLHRIEAKTQLFNVFHVGFNRFAPEFLVFHVGLNVFLAPRARMSRVSCGF